MLAQLAVLALQADRLDALLVRLPGSVWALPGAPAGAEPLEQVARRALADQTGVEEIALEQLYTFDRDGGAAASVAWLGLVAAPRHRLRPGPGVVEVRWFPLDDLPALAAADREVLAYAHARLRAKAAYSPIALQLLPETFTLAQVQAAYEAVLGHALDTRNFRRDLLAAGVVEAAGRSRGQGPGRPARLYRPAPGDFQVLARERRIARAIAGPPATEGESQ
ncbi:MAG: NUDIX domain-containing protein [Thermoleophilia bacterium]